MNFFFGFFPTPPPPPHHFSNGPSLSTFFLQFYVLVRQELNLAPLMLSPKENLDFGCAFFLFCLGCPSVIKELNKKEYCFWIKLKRSLFGKPLGIYLA